ncbi:DUF5677 domain-containing protein [Micromonospora taraxaci]|uniref:DUF5677 domain-containing protein n=1 Tax=Micromonospora taraxaci TaxID=1316803 RepID=UPI0033AC3CB7
MRRTARDLVDCEPWPADDATTGEDVAQLALLRLLWLQKQTRRAVRGRHREAAVLLARSSLEACILALYCLHSPEAVARLKAGQLKTGKKLLAFLHNDGIVPHEVINEVLDELGSTSPGPLTVRDMAKLVDTETGGTLAADLYDRLYAPTSTYFVHANPASLLRHVKPDRTLAGRPNDPWARRSPARLADACVGLVAAAIAGRCAKSDSLFINYAESHAARTMAPMVVMTFKAIARSLKPTGILRAGAAVVSLRRYLQGPAKDDPVEVREARIRMAFDKALGGFGLPLNSLDAYAAYLIDELANRQ